jgi:SAM-dependent methyltransferase
MKNKQVDKSWYGENAGFFGSGYFTEYEEECNNEKIILEVDFLEKHLPINQGASILDCPCGYGRHSIELARRGYKMTGQDLNGFFIRKARALAKKANVSLRLIKKDMRKIPYKNEFDYAINLFSSFGYLENENEDQKVLDQTMRALRLGGRFILDVINRDYVIHTYKVSDYSEVESGMVTIINREFDSIAGRNNERRLRIWSNGKREETFHSMRMYTVAELIKMLQKSGFNIRHIYGGYNMETLTINSERCIIVSDTG